MTGKEARKRLASVVYTLILAGELAVVLDVVSVLGGRALSVPKFGILLLGLFAALWLLPEFRPERRRLAALVCTLVLVIPLTAGWLCWRGVSQSVVFRSEDTGKEALYGGKKVMLLVPHQDDDINVLGGVLEEYVKYGSEVFVVFSTNGDYYGLAETRFREAHNALGNIGIPQDHVIFLGYGDQWSKDGPHLYNAQPGQVMTSVFGARETYGTDAAAVYREGREYTIDNFLEDIEAVILEHRPDVLYCVDYDYNIDHRALSHAFEKVMGRILKNEEGYAPLVLKGYAYNTAWEAVNDFYAENLLATYNAFDEQYSSVPAVYRWEDRVRLPVNGETLSRSVLTAEQNVSLAMYESQGAWLYGVRVLNGDKVFWQRRTDSLCYDAQIHVSSGDGALLNDFMLLECRDLLEGEPYDGVWMPEDGEKQVTVTFPEPRDVAAVALYDHPDGASNVLNARIEFDDGYFVETGPLDPGGAETAVTVDRKGVSAFTVTLLETEGKAGLTEVEAFESGEKWQPEFVKLMDEEGNFVYDYWIEPDGEQVFRVYDPADLVKENGVFCLNQHCDAVWEDGGIRVTCPEGESCLIYVTGEGGERLDTVYIRNPGTLERGWKNFWLGVEERVVELCEVKRLHERVFVCRLLSRLV